ncbi:hypothetical protein SAMN05421686_1245, partial [Thalassolituus maritimus]
TVRDFTLESGMKALKTIQGRVPEVSTKVVADHAPRSGVMLKNIFK